MVHSNKKILDIYSVSYLKHNEIDVDNHKLSYSISLNNNYSCIQKCLDEEDRHITTTQREVINYDTGCLMTKERCKSLISNMGNITEIRYIILTKKVIKYV